MKNLNASNYAVEKVINNSIGKIAHKGDVCDKKAD